MLLLFLDGLPLLIRVIASDFMGANGLCQLSHLLGQECKPDEGRIGVPLSADIEILEPTGMCIDIHDDRPLLGDIRTASNTIDRGAELSRNIVVYCGASSGNGGRFEEAAVKVADWIAAKGDTLIYGGGNVGLMGIVARRVLAKGGKVHGVIPRILKERGTALEGITELSVVEDMPARKRMMLELGDVCLALPGGPGTLEEISEAFSWSRLGLNPNPCIFFDVDGFWRSTADMYDRMVADGFLTEEDRGKLLFTQSFDAIDEWVGQYRPPRIRQYRTQGKAA